ncbi:MAG: hypothetical protein WCF23_19410, partial [Candidatus Nitrosopolaris sp.]
KKISKHGQRNDAKSIVVQYVQCKKIDCKRYHIVGSQVMQHCTKNANDAYHYYYCNPDSSLILRFWLESIS